MDKLSDQLTLVTVGFNSAAVLVPHIESLLRSASGALPRWIVVDNASSDGTADHLKRYDGVVELVQSPENVGFGAACNLGIAATTTRYVLVLNPDTELSEAALQALLAELKAHGAAIAGPSLQPDIENKVDDVDWLVGAALLMDRELMDEVGYFDERFFLYEEDVDLCKRANDQGLRVIHCKGISIPHVGGGSTARTKEVNEFIHYHKGRSYAMYVSKHHPGSDLLRRYVKKNRKRMAFAAISFGLSRYRRARAKLRGVASLK